MQCSEFDVKRMDEFHAVAFGCPSMGSEQLEEAEFEPMFSSCEAKPGGKKTGLSGSYGIFPFQGMGIISMRKV